jgi:hypothetical protein
MEIQRRLLTRFSSPPVLKNSSVKHFRNDSAPQKAWPFVGHGLGLLPEFFVVKEAVRGVAPCGTRGSYRESGVFCDFSKWLGLGVTKVLEIFLFLLWGDCRFE